MKEKKVPADVARKEVKGESGIVYENKSVPDPNLGRRDTIVPQNGTVTPQGE